MKYKRNEPLKKHTSFKIGGAAKYFCCPKDLAELSTALSFASKQQLPIYIIGAGTNILVADQGLPGLVIKLAKGLDYVKIENQRVIAGAGVFLPRLVKFLSQKGLGNLGFLAGIPGSVGGAVVMNAGAWGKEIGQFVDEVRVLDFAGQEKALKPEQLKFGYRSSILQKQGYIVYEVVLQTKKVARKETQAKLNEYLAKRRQAQPIGAPNCGSVFKNPPGDFAGRIIEAAGCKGLRVGDAQVSLKHANFILNLGEAKATDVLSLMARIQKAVKQKLEPEIKVLQ